MNTFVENYINDSEGVEVGTYYGVKINLKLLHQGDPNTQNDVWRKGAVIVNDSVIEFSRKSNVGNFFLQFTMSMYDNSFVNGPAALNVKYDEEQNLLKELFQIIHAGLSARHITENSSHDVSWRVMAEE